MQVDYSFLDEKFKPLFARRGVICFGSVCYEKRGKYISYDLTIPPTDVNRKFYREMVKLWGKFLEKPVKELNVKGKETHIIMDMEKYSLSFILSVFTSFRFLTDGFNQPSYYCSLRNKYRKLPIFTALVLAQYAEISESQEHCFIPYSGVTVEGLPKLMTMTLEDKLPLFEKQETLLSSKAQKLLVYSTWGYQRDYYAHPDFTARKIKVEELIVKMFYNKKGKK